MDKPKITIKKGKDKEYYLSRDYISEDLKKQLYQSDIVILPNKGFRDYKKPVFAHGTENIYLYLKSNLPREYNFEIAIDDDDYEEFSLNDDLIYLGIFMFKDILLPLIINLLSSYVIHKSLTKRNNERVKFKMILTDSSKKIDYEGPIEGFKLIAKEVKKSIKSEWNKNKRILD